MDRARKGNSSMSKDSSTILAIGAAGQFAGMVVGKEGITVNVVAPGLTLTPAVAQSMPPEMVEAQVKARAIQRDEKGEDLVSTVFFLASPDADFMSGQTLNVDGGKHML
jgi:NAD(P)-dependent dehydrogenase (short-subunit alcohol dehydrogenase family)